MAGMTGPSGLTNPCSHGSRPSIPLSRVTAWSPAVSSPRPRLPLYEETVRRTRAHAAAIEEAIRATRVIRTNAVRRWTEGRGVRATDRPVLCARLAHAFACAARLTSPACQADGR